MKQRQVSYEEGIGLCKALSDDDEFFIMDTNGFGYKQYREKCLLLCDGYLRTSECALWSNSDFNCSFNIIPSILSRKTEHIPFIPMDIYGLCFKFYFLGHKSTINYFETSAKTNEGIDEMIASLARTRVEIDDYHPPPRPRPFTRDQGDWIKGEEEIKYKKQSGGIWCMFSYVSNLLSSYL